MHGLRRTCPLREREHVNELAQQLCDQGLLVNYITHDISQMRPHVILKRIVDAAKDAMTAEELGINHP